MDGGGSQPGQCSPVSGCAVAFVLGKAVPWESCVQSQHEPVPMHLGDDGRRGDGEAGHIAVGYCLLGKLDLWQREVVNEKALRGNLQSGQCQVHCLPGGWYDPLCVDLLCFHCAHTHRMGLLMDSVEKLLPPARREELGITDGFQFGWNCKSGGLLPDER